MHRRFLVARSDGHSFLIPFDASVTSDRSPLPPILNECGPGEQTGSESQLPLLQRSSAPVRLLTLDQVRMRVDGRAIRLDTFQEVLEAVSRDVPRRDDVLARRTVTGR